MLTSGHLLQATHSFNHKTVHVLLKWVRCRRRISISLYSILWDLQGMLERGEEEKRKIYEAPLQQVNMGFKLRLRCCEDLCLISFRCWLAGVWLREGTHIFAVSHYWRFGWPCLEEQSRLCAYLPTGFVWPSATANWQHAACSDTNGKS